MEKKRRVDIPGSKSINASNGILVPEMGLGEVRDGALAEACFAIVSWAL